MASSNSILSQLKRVFVVIEGDWSEIDGFQKAISSLHLLLDIQHSIVYEDTGMIMVHQRNNKRFVGINNS